MSNELEATRTLLRKITEAQFPDELVAFDLGYEPIVEVLNTGRGDDDRAQLGMAVVETGTAVLSFAKLMYGVWSFAAQVMRDMNRPAPRDATVDLSLELLEQHLVDAGLEQEKARAIVRNHGNELVLLKGLRA